MIISSVHQPLTIESAIELTKRLKFFNSNARLTCKEIGDEIVNLVFHITDSQNSKGLIIKQALPNAEVGGKTWPISLQRAVIETHSLLTNASYVPTLVPRVYYFDESLAITVLEDLSHLTICRTGLSKGATYPLLSDHIGTYFARTLFFTSDFSLEPKVKKGMVQQFVNGDVCKITEELVFTVPFFNDNANDYEAPLQRDVDEIRKDVSLKQEVSKLKRKFSTQADALIHGNLHTGNIIASETETKIINPEFAYFGPFGYDIGQFIANLLLHAISQQEEGKETILAHIDNTWNVFMNELASLWESDGLEVYTMNEGYLQQLLKQTFEDAIGYAGCELIRRSTGTDPVAGLDDIYDPHTRINAKRNGIALGKSLITDRFRITSTKELRKYLESILQKQIQTQY